MHTKEIKVYYAVEKTTAPAV